MTRCDVLILGKGPAGLAAAAELAARGVSVAVLAPSGGLHWPAQYGAWMYELEAIGRPDLAEHRWSETVVALGPRGTRVLPHGYARVDKARLARELLERCDAAGVRWVTGKAAAAEHGARDTVLRCEGGGEVAASLVIDASGHRPALVRRARTPLPGFQTAVGLTFETADAPIDSGRAILMDWDDAHLPPEERAALPHPSFLYAMPLGNGTVFAEETVLVGRPPVAFEPLERRLRLRLAALGVRPGPILEREHCFIPMGGALPDPAQRVVGFGGGAAMVHPATGYMLVRVLEAAPHLARVVASELGAAGAEPGQVARAAWDTLWPAERRRRRALFAYGMEVLLRLDARAMQRFFELFFSLPDREWQGYLSDGLPTAQLARTMGRAFARAPAGLRATLLRTGAGPTGLRLAAELLRSARG